MKLKKKVDGGEQGPGKQVPKPNQPTQADSLALYNNSKLVEAFYRNHGYTTDTKDKDVSNYNSTNDYVASRFHGKAYTSKGVVPIAKEDYRKDIDQNRYYQRELQVGQINMDAPMTLFDRRIKPQFSTTYANKNESDPIAGDVADVYTYDPIAVKPWNMLTDSERLERIQKYGAPHDYTPPTTHPSVSAPPLPPPPQRSQVQGPQQLTPAVPQIGAPTGGLGPLAGGPTNFSFTGRDDNGQQTTRYFPDLSSWQAATEAMGYRNRETTNNNQEAHATGYQFKRGGMKKADIGGPAMHDVQALMAQDPRVLAMMQQDDKQAKGWTNAPQQTGNGLQINWDHAFATQVAQSLVGGAVSRFSPNSQQNTIQQFNKQQFSPVNYLPYTPNVSQQAQYGTMEDGGQIDPPTKKPKYNIPNAFMFDMGNPNYTPTPQDSVLYKQTFDAAQQAPNNFNYQQMNQAAMNNYLVHNELGYTQNRANYLRDANKAAAVWDAQHPFKKGGAIGMDMGGGIEGGDPFTAANIYNSHASGIKDADLVDRLNAALTGGKYTGSPQDLSQDALGLVNSANIYRQTHQGTAPQQAIQGWFNSPVGNNPQDVLRQRLNKIGYGADAMYNSTPNTSVKMEQGGTFDMGESMRKWIMDDEEQTPQPEQQEEQPQQQQGPSEQDYDAMQFANFVQMFGLDQADGEQEPGDQEQPMFKKGGGIHIQKSHEGRFTAYKKRTGKTTEEALHSKDPHVRKMANFAKNASKWHHKEGGLVNFKEGGEYNMSKQDIDYYRSMGYEIDEI